DGLGELPGVDGRPPCGPRVVDLGGGRAALEGGAGRVDGRDQIVGVSREGGVGRGEDLVRDVVEQGLPIGIRDGGVGPATAALAAAGGGERERERERETGTEDRRK